VTDVWREVTPVLIYSTFFRGGLPLSGGLKFFRSPSGISQMLPAIVCSSFAFGSKPRLIHDRTETELTPYCFATSDAFKNFLLTNFNINEIKKNFKGILSTCKILLAFNSYRM
jgi:hypothetical protein